MAQLSDDCFAFSGPLMPLADMEKLIAERVQPVAETEVVSLNDARGRVIAENIASLLDLPPFDNSAVDGYAVRHRDLAATAETKLKVTGRLTAGKSAPEPISPGQAVRIFTGAPMPPGADTVFMQEDVQVEGDTVILPPGLKPGSNSRLTGEDVKKGAVVLPAGRRLATQDIALAAGIGLTRLKVRRRVRVALFSTGDEIVEPGQPRPNASTYDANRYLLSGMLERLGATVTDLGIIKDEPASLVKAIGEAARTNDLVLTSGGVSTGEADYVRDAVKKVGKLVFWRVAIKPGRPVALGMLGQTPLLGLPGNPVAALVTFWAIGRPLLDRLLSEYEIDLVFHLDFEQAKSHLDGLAAINSFSVPVRLVSLGVDAPSQIQAVWTQYAADRHSRTIASQTSRSFTVGAPTAKGGRSSIT